MQALPRWVWIGAVTLSAAAGMINVIGYLGFNQQVVSHVTGTTSLLGVELARGQWHDAGFVWGLLIAFSLGATLSGLLIQNQQLQLGRRYGVALLLESMLILAAIPLYAQHPPWATWLLAMACGLQNAMATTYSGAVVRTTHLTGMFTDLGIGLGHLLRGLPLQTRRLVLCGFIISGFLGGSLAGAWLFAHFHYRALYLPAAITGITGGIYFGYRQWMLVRAPSRP
ncbi:MAG TPA: YoaK family protein [Stenotrophomonas sp.]|jgi:uncharacterized membrane protein YoaK (UPF0700 family)